MASPTSDPLLATPTSPSASVPEAAPALFDGHADYLLRIADTPLVLAQRLAEWVGAAPTLEEEMALANFALDLLGQATLVLDHAARMYDDGRSADDLAFLRTDREFTNLLLAELPIGDFAVTIVRQVLYEAWASVWWPALATSADPQLAGIAAKAARETSYHLDHSVGWLVRLADGTDESRARVAAAIELLWPFFGECLLADELDQRAAAAGVAPLPSSLADALLARIADIFAAAQLPVPDDAYWQRGGRQGLHTEHLGHLLAEMQVLQRQHPGAIW